MFHLMISSLFYNRYEDVLINNMIMDFKIKRAKIYLNVKKNNIEKKEKAFNNAN